jgi:serine/threonine-protein kinase
MLNGAPPFTGKTAQAVLAAHLTEAPAPVTRRRPSVPAPLAELVMRCLEKKPADRWQTADEMVTRLESMGTPSGGMEPSRAMPAVGRSASGGLRRWLVGGAVVVAAGLGLWAVAFRDRSELLRFRKFR